MVGVGAIGLGGLGHIELNICAEMDDVNVIAGADISPGARDLFESDFNAPAYEEYTQLLDTHANELDAVMIVTPHTLHYEEIRDCLRDDAHVLVEKPMVTNITDAVDVVEIARERNLILQVGYQRHFHPAFVEMKRILESGRIGKIHAASAHLGQDWVSPHRDTWRMNPELSGGGQLYDTGSHLLDAILWTTNSEPNRVAAEIDYLEPKVDVNSALAMTLDRDGEPATVSVSVSGDGVSIDPKEGYFIWGTEGRVTYTGDTLTVAEKDAVTYTTRIDEGSDFHTLTRKKLRNFINSIQGTAEPAVSGEYGLQVTALTEGAYEAADTGRTVDVQDRIRAARESRD